MHKINQTFRKCMFLSMFIKLFLSASDIGAYYLIIYETILLAFHKLLMERRTFHNNPKSNLKILENIYNLYKASDLWKMNIIIFHLFKDFTLTKKSRYKFKSIPSCKAPNDEWHVYFTRKVLLHWNQCLIIQFIIHERNVFLDKL